MSDTVIFSGGTLRSEIATGNVSRWHNGEPRGRFDTFADNFAGGDPTPAGAAHRPVELAQAPDGSLYLSDDKAGWMADLLCRSGSPK